MRVYGRVHVPDKRDNQHKLKARKSKRTRRMWRDDQVWDNQLREPSCVGHAWWFLLASQPHTWPFHRKLDPNGLYELCKFRDEYEGEDYEGTSVRAGADVLKTLGLIKAYEWSWNLDTTVNAVLEKGPVVLGLPWYKGCDEPDRRGVIRATGDLLGGHCILATGVDTKKKEFRLKQSWGQEVGDDGHIYLPFEDMEKMFDVDAEACMAIE